MNKKFKVKNIIIISFVILLFVVIIPIIINESYKHGYLYSTVWTGADMLMFYGSMFSGLGSIILGIIAFYQNKKFKEENDIAQTRIEKSNKESQERLERINERSNELNAINSILNHKIKIFEDIEYELTEFIKNFEPDKLIKCLTSNDKQELVQFKINMTFSFVKVESKIRSFDNKYATLIINEIKEYQNVVCEISNRYNKKKFYKTVPDQDLNKLVEVFGNVFLKNGEFVKEYNDKFDKILYDNFTLKEVNNLFEKQQGKNNNKGMNNDDK